MPSGPKSTARPSENTWRFKVAKKRNTPKVRTLADQKARVQELLAQDRSRLLMKQPFVGSLLMRLDLIPVRDSRLKTAATDGDRVYVDIDFYASLTAEERLFVLAHESWHCALIHFVRRQNRDPERFNIAADLEIHFLLTAEGLKAPFVLPHNPGWNGLSCEEIYERYSSPESCSIPGIDSVNIRAGQSGEGQSFDRHLQKGELAPGDGDAPDGEGGGADGNARDPEFVPVISRGAEERCRERLSAAVQQYQRIKGDLPLGMRSVVEAVLKPELDWRELLAQFVTSCYGGNRRWLPPSRRHIWQGLYLQSRRQELLRAVVAVDTSGSTCEDLPRFFTELASLLGSFGKYELTVIQCDAEIQSVECFDDTRPLRPDRKWEIRGGGGTDFRPVFTYLETDSTQQVDLLIYLTDGYGDYPDRPPAFPVLWILTSGGSCEVNWGARLALDPAGN